MFFFLFGWPFAISYCVHIFFDFEVNSPGLVNLPCLGRLRFVQIEEPIYTMAGNVPWIFFQFDQVLEVILGNSL